jgi:hypothetical protein
VENALGSARRSDRRLALRCSQGVL